MPYYDRLITKIAELFSYEKVSRANGRCNAFSLIISAQNLSATVNQPDPLSATMLWKEVEKLNTEVQQLEQLKLRHVSLTNKIHELTRKHNISDRQHSSEETLVGLTKLQDYLEEKHSKEKDETLFARVSTRMQEIDIGLQRSLNKKLQNIINEKKNQYENIKATIEQVLE
ncbi:hypothetical protein ZHAS_00018560 [Anopheles sinensis]|uniref:Uncharacterized protein n=1 Tax=Anopheles sinensis TaxID=74873 RepID=A0A084WJX6_ANOSI|nr:hypothetical protein ZHAS_00018560 [Anopheles sinensis]